MSSLVLKNEKISNWLESLLGIALASWFLALCAQVRIHIPFSPVPFTAQLLAVGLIGAFLGRNKGTLAVLLYLAQGFLGLPFFSGLNSGFGYLSGPVFGYLIAFPVFAYLVGYIKEAANLKNVWLTTLMVFLASQIVLAAGTLWLASFVGFSKSFWLGWIPFIPFDLIKCYGIAIYLKLWDKRGDGKSRV